MHLWIGTSSNFIALEVDKFLLEGSDGVDARVLNFFMELFTLSIFSSVFPNVVLTLDSLFRSCRLFVVKSVELLLGSDKVLLYTHLDSITQQVFDFCSLGILDVFS